MVSRGFIESLWGLEVLMGLGEFIGHLWGQRDL